MLELNWENVAVLVVARGVSLFLIFHLLLQNPLLGVDHYLYFRGLPSICVDIDGDVLPGGGDEAVVGCVGVGVVDDVGGVVFVLFFVEEEDGFCC